MADKKKRVYRFGGKTAEGDGSMRNLLGGKGANLAEMCRLNIPVPAGFTITTECCAEYYQLGGGYTDELKAEVADAMKATEAIMGKKFGDSRDPLLVSCRSGARSSMPGMMDTILNIGLCSATIPGLIEKTGNPRFVYDAYRRLIMMYSDVVMEKAEGTTVTRCAFRLFPYLRAAGTYIPPPYPFYLPSSSLSALSSRLFSSSSGSFMKSLR